jgi:hypothetical protein
MTLHCNMYFMMCHHLPHTWTVDWPPAMKKETLLLIGKLVLIYMILPSMNFFGIQLSHESMNTCTCSTSVEVSNMYDLLPPTNWLPTYLPAYTPDLLRQTDLLTD